MDIYKHNPDARSAQAAGVSQVPAISTALVTGPSDTGRLLPTFQSSHGPFPHCSSKWTWPAEE